MDTYYIVDEKLKEYRKETNYYNSKKTFEKFDKKEFCYVEEYITLIEKDKNDFETLTDREWLNLNLNQQNYKILFFDKENIIDLKRNEEILERLNVIKKTNELYTCHMTFRGYLILTLQEKEEFEKIQEEAIENWKKQKAPLIHKLKFLFDMVVSSTENSKIKNELIEKINKFIKTYDLNLNLWEYYKDKFML